MGNKSHLRARLVAFGVVGVLLVSITPVEQLFGRLFKCLFSCEITSISCCRERSGIQSAAVQGPQIGAPRHDEPLDGCPLYAVPANNFRSFQQLDLVRTSEVTAPLPDLGGLDVHREFAETTGVGILQTLPRPPPASSVLPTSA